MSALTLLVESAKRPSPRTLRLIALGYLVKTLIVGLAWYFDPQLPTRVAALGSAAWGWFLTE